jgi:uncharacterized protein YifE (UPF0438 family)
MSPEHQVYLKKVFYPQVPLPRAKFSEAEIKLLLKFGSWYSALQERKIAAISIAQQRFVACMSGQVLPTTPHELVWSRYMQALQAASHSGSEISHEDPSADGVWNSSSFDELIAMQRKASGAEPLRPHQFTGGVMDHEGENYDPSAIH